MTVSTRVSSEPRAATMPHRWWDARLVRSHPLPFVLTLVWLFVGAPMPGHAQPASSGELPATLRLDDDFVYQVVDYGLGAVSCEGRASGNVNRTGIAGERIM